MVKTNFFGNDQHTLPPYYNTVFDSTNLEFSYNTVQAWLPLPILPWIQ